MTMTFTEGMMYAALLLPSFAFFLSVSPRPAAAVARLACLGLGCVAAIVFAVRLSGLLSGPWLLDSGYLPGGYTATQYLGRLALSVLLILLDIVLILDERGSIDLSGRRAGRRRARHGRGRI